MELTKKQRNARIFFEYFEENKPQAEIARKYKMTPQRLNGLIKNKKWIKLKYDIELALQVCNNAKKGHEADCYHIALAKMLNSYF